MKKGELYIYRGYLVQVVDVDEVTGLVKYVYLDINENGEPVPDGDILEVRRSHALKNFK